MNPECTLERPHGNHRSLSSAVDTPEGVGSRRALSESQRPESAGEGNRTDATKENSDKQMYRCSLKRELSKYANYNTETVRDGEEKQNKTTCRPPEARLRPNTADGAGLQGARPRPRHSKAGQTNQLQTKQTPGQNTVRDRRGTAQ